LKRFCLAFLVLMLAASSGFAILPGPIKDFYTPRLGDTTAVVFGTRNLQQEWIKKMEHWAHRNADFVKQRDSSRVVHVFGTRRSQSNCLVGGLWF
jgi:hypothetical protein